MKKEQTEKPSNKIQFGHAVKLNVGGMIYKTSLVTLLSDANSMLAAMFSGRHEIQHCEDDGAYFIDRDGTNFRYILNYLRDGRLICPSDVTTRLEIKAEAEFFQVQGILDELQPKTCTGDETCCFLGSSKIITNKVLDSLLSSWLPSNAQCSLLYRASRDGWSAADFHKRCDNQGGTVTLLRSRDGYDGGGYTTKSWETSKTAKAKPDFSAFLFSLTNPSSHEPTVLRNVSDRHGNPGGIVCSTHTGPYFGTSMHFDLKTLEADIDGSALNFVDVGHGFECPEGQNRRKFLFGSSTVILEELEVFRVGY